MDLLIFFVNEMVPSPCMIISISIWFYFSTYLSLLSQMTAEFQVPSPLVPTRENYFVRYCKQHTDATWAVVDVSLDSLCPSLMSKCRRRSSGCLIQELPNGYSNVILSLEHHFQGLTFIATLKYNCQNHHMTIDHDCEGRLG
jgi:hypothetical protein